MNDSIGLSRVMGEIRDVPALERGLLFKTAMRVVGLLLLIVATLAGCSFGSPQLSPVPHRTGEGGRGAGGNGENTDTSEDMLTPSGGEPLPGGPQSDDRLPPADDAKQAPAEPSVEIKWNAVPGFRYALSVKSGGVWIFPCIGTEVLGESTSVRYDGVCTSADNRAPVSTVTAYRIHYSNNGEWNDFVEAAASWPSGAVVELTLPTSAPSSVSLIWNRKSPTAEYSLDVVTKEGKLIAPCVGAIVLLKSTAYRYTGRCSTANDVAVPIADVTSFRICSAEGGDWANAHCAGVSYNGLRSEVAIAN